ncbi:MAG: renalase [Planctomycetota bacterium]|jgi:renalase
MTISSHTPAARLHVGIVGAGMAGLAAARTLTEAGHDVAVFDKGRGPGGRSASRRAAPFAFDHGAQYFTARDPNFTSVLETWLRAGVAARWEGRVVSLRAGVSWPVVEETKRFVGTPHMNALAKYLARNIEVHCRSRVASVERLSRGWKLVREDGVELGEFERLVITTPPPQAAALISNYSPLGERAASIPMRPCWAVLLGLGEPYSAAFDGAFCEGAALSWVARDNSKPGRGTAESWVLHASAEWTEAHLEEDPVRVAFLLVKELELLTGLPVPAVIHRDAHLWLFAQPHSAFSMGVLHDNERGLLLAGDAYCGGRIEGAYLSGLAAAHRLI